MARAPHFSRRDFNRIFLAGAGSGIIGSLGAWPNVAGAAAAAPTFKTVNPGFITLGMNGEMPSSGIIDGKPVGIDVEMVSRIATKVGLGVKPALMEWGSIIEAVKSGRVDVMIGNVRWSAARTQVMYLTDAVYYVAYGLITKQDRVMPPNAKIANLKGANIGTMVGATATTEMKKVPGIGEVRFFDRTDSVVRDVLAGRLDFAVLDPMTIAYMSKQDPTIKLKKVLLEYDAEFPLLTGKTESVLGMSKDNPDLYDMMNAGIRWLWRTKQTAEILAKYGMSEDFLVAPPTVRVGTDRDAAGNVINMSNHTPKDYSALFA